MYKNNVQPVYFSWKKLFSIVTQAGIIFCMCQVNERWHYTVTLSLFDWAQTQIYPRSSINNSATKITIWENNIKNCFKGHEKEMKYME